MHIYIHLFINIYIYIYIHTHTHIYIRCRSSGERQGPPAPRPWHGPRSYLHHGRPLREVPPVVQLASRPGVSDGHQHWIRVRCTENSKTVCGSWGPVFICLCADFFKKFLQWSNSLRAQAFRMAINTGFGYVALKNSKNCVWVPPVFMCCGLISSQSSSSGRTRFAPRRFGWPSTLDSGTLHC